MKIKLVVFLVTLLAMGGSLSAIPRHVYDGAWNHPLPVAPVPVDLSESAAAAEAAMGQTHTFPALDTNNAFTGNISVNNAAGAGANDLTLGMINRTRWNCGNGSGYRFGSIASALSDVQTNATQGGFIWTCPDNSSQSSPETFTSQVEIGSATKTAALELHPGQYWNCAITVNAPYCWGIHNASALVGANNGHIGGTRVGGAFLKYGCTANTTNGITTVEGLSQQQGFGLFTHIMFEGCPTGTVGAGSPSKAMLNIEGISSMNQWDNFEIFNFANTFGVRVASNNVGANNAVIGPIVLTNPWSDGGYNTGAKPGTITATAGSCAGVLPISVIGGAFTHPGSGNNVWEVNGQSCSGAMFGGIFAGHYTENQQNGVTTHFKFVDASNFNVAGTASALQATDTLIDISKVGDDSCNLTFQNMRSNNGTTVNNHISGFTQSGKSYLSLYHFGGDASCSFYPLLIDWNTLQIRPNLQATGLLVKNSQDQIMNGVDIDSGLTAAQQAVGPRWLDRGTVEWQAYKDASNGWNVRDMVNSKSRIQFSQTASVTTSAGINLAGTELLSAQEGNGLAGTGLVDILWADTGTHRWRMNNNNAGQDTVGDVLVQSCGTTSTCSATNIRIPQIVEGSAPLVSGTPSTVIITGFSPAFTSTTSYNCTLTNQTNAANSALKVVNTSASSITITGPNTITDTIGYICVGN